MPYTRTQTGHGRNPCPVSPRSQSLPQGPGLPIPSPASQGAAQWGPPGPSPPWLHQPHGSDPTGLQITCGVLVLFCGFLVPGKGAEHAEGFLLVAAQAWVSPFTHFLARIKLFFFFFWHFNVSVETSRKWSAYSSRLETANRRAERQQDSLSLCDRSVCCKH